MLVIIPCGGKKLENLTPVRAEDLYTGPYFKGCLRYAKSIVVPDKILILSAKYGLLRLGEFVLPYEQRMDKPGHILPEVVLCQALEMELLDEEVVAAFGGVAYLAVAKMLWPTVKTPAAGLSIGRQLQWLKQNLGKW